MKTRLFSAIIMALIFIPVLIVGKFPFHVFVLLLAILAQRELLKARRTKKEFPIAMELASYLLLGAITLNNVASLSLELELPYYLLSAIFLVLLLPTVFYNNSKLYNLNDAFFLISSVLFIGISTNAMILLRNFSLLYVVYLLIITTVTDSFAYITGKFIGLNKLAPKISPNKTIEGLVGGTIWGSLAGAVFYNTVIDPNVNFAIILFLTTVLSIVAQIGDLMFSAIKRYYDRKDFSNLIPGHGGILDRIDSFIFIVLTFVLFLVLL